MGGRVESGFEFGITCSDTMRNYWLFQKLKLLGYGEFNDLTNILTFIMIKYSINKMTELLPCKFESELHEFGFLFQLMWFFQVISLKMI